MNPFSLPFGVPIFLAFAWGWLEGFGLSSGSPWAWRMGIIFQRYEETLPLDIPDALPEVTDGVISVRRVAPNTINYCLGGASGRRQGLNCHGVIHVLRGPGETTFRYEGRLCLSPFILYAALLVDVTLTYGAQVAAVAALLFGLFMAMFVALDCRRLLPAYHMLTADLAARGTRRRGAEDRESSRLPANAAPQGVR